jgi:hypothetical protein
MNEVVGAPGREVQKRLIQRTALVGAAVSAGVPTSKHERVALVPVALLIEAAAGTNEQERRTD